MCEKMMYENELKAIVKASRFRERKIYDNSLIDFASNDYLGLSEKKQLLKRAYERVNMFPTHAPKASLMVNGYHEIHYEFEEFLCRQNGFEAAHVVGSGFLANLSLIEALPRKADVLLMDEEYHASGILASKLLFCEVCFFKHNDAEALEKLLQSKKYKRAIVAVEGIYSMSGDVLNRDIFDVVDRYNTVLIVDEAHSSGVIGKNLLGVFDLYDISPKENYIKMGTLGKAYGSYGAYILSSNHIRDFLQNRAKALIYATAPSLFDIALAHQGMLYIFKHKTRLHQEFLARIDLIQELFCKEISGLIFPYYVQNSQEVLLLQKQLQKEGFLVGAIRPPTVNVAMLRIIPRLNVDFEVTKNFFNKLKEMTF
jgi:8-amino-7-oxononanoate synthase